MYLKVQLYSTKFRVPVCCLSVLNLDKFGYGCVTVLPEGLLIPENLVCSLNLVCEENSSNSPVVTSTKFSTKVVTRSSTKFSTVIGLGT